MNGNITYRFYLGNNVTSDFNIERNKHYMLTLQLSDWGGLTEDGYIGPDGNWNANGGGASWRVDATFQNTGIVGNILEIPANGSRVDIELVGYNNVGNNVHLKYSETGSGSNQVWVKDRNKGWIINPSTTNLNNVLFKNNDGTSTIQIYVKPIGKTELETIGGALTTVEEWMEKGCRDLDFYIEGTKDPKLDVSFTIRQWLPMPVMDPADVGTSTNPNHAKLYFSRFDIYHGKIMPWCHEQLQNKDLWSILVTDQNTLNIWNDFETQTPLQTYDRTNGFHKTVAYFATNDQQGTLGEIDFNDGLPQTMMAYAFFGAANAEAITGGMFVQNAADATTFSHYGLPSIEEWEKIEKYGKYDSRYPLLPGLQYWTSTIDNEDGSKNMVYTMGTGTAGASPKVRSQMYPGRLVYRKDAKATKP